MHSRLACQAGLPVIDKKRIVTLKVDILSYTMDMPYIDLSFLTGLPGEVLIYHPALVIPNKTSKLSPGSDINSISYNLKRPYFRMAWQRICVPIMPVIFQ